MENKPRVSLLIPYKITDGEIFVYLQKRTKDAKWLADLFGFFGGKVEGEESYEDGLKREIKEELNFVPEGYEIIGKYESTKSLRQIFMLKVDEGFEKKVKVSEGEYGKFFSEDEVLKESKILESYKKILQDLFDIVRKREKL